MRLFALILMFTSFSASAQSLMTVKERLRLHLWSYGLEEKPVKVKQLRKPLPEELERALKGF